MVQIYSHNRLFLPPATGHRPPPATGHQRPPAISGHRPSAAPAATGHRPPAATGHRPPPAATGPPAHRLTAYRPTGQRPPANGHRPPATHQRSPAATGPLLLLQSIACQKPLPIHGQRPPVHGPPATCHPPARHWPWRRLSTPTVKTSHTEEAESPAIWHQLPGTTAWDMHPPFIINFFACTKLSHPLLPLRLLDPVSSFPFKNLEILAFTHHDSNLVC